MLDRTLNATFVFISEINPCMFYQQVMKKWESRCSRLQAEITAEKSKYMKLRQQLERKANSTDDTVRFFYNIIHLYRLCDKHMELY